MQKEMKYFRTSKFWCFLSLFPQVHQKSQHNILSFRAIPKFLLESKINYLEFHQIIKLKKSRHFQLPSFHQHVDEN